MSYRQSSARYFENDVLSRSPEWLVPLLYEHLVVNLRRAAVHIEQNDLEAKAECLSRASGIVLELATTLDFDKGGDLARQLSALYTFFASSILDIGRTLDVALLDGLIRIATDLHEAWTEAAEQVAPRGRSGQSIAAPALV